jgi:hypothetical protein
MPHLATVLTGQHADKHLSDRRVSWAACAPTKEADPGSPPRAAGDAWDLGPGCNGPGPFRSH